MNLEESWPDQAAGRWAQDGLGGVLRDGAGCWQRAEWRQGGCLELEAVLLLPGPRPLSFCLPSTFPTSPPRCPPPTPQGSRFRFAVESLRGLIPSSVTLHPCGGAPLVYFLSPGCPHRPLLPSPTLLSRGRSALLTKPFLPQTTHLPISELPGGGGVYSRVLGQPFPGYSPPPSFPEISRISLPHSTSLPPPANDS